MEVEDESTDIMPLENDLNNLLKWNARSRVPDLSKMNGLYVYHDRR